MAIISNVISEFGGKGMLALIGAILIIVSLLWHPLTFFQDLITFVLGVVFVILAIR